MTKVIKAEGLSKAYQLGDFGTGTISRDLERFWARMRGKEDPFLKIGEANDRTTKGGSDIVWSLRDINFEIEQGDAVGVIGRNGAGKSTLLKVLSRVTSPTTGSVKIKGRIASLLEVGTGFHPELTGRENIFLNGAILGMRKTEIKRKFDEIVAFAGVERYIDTPVKRYSSGMYVRLAFAVAAHLESEILIVDEVLAVGDAEFQKKCLGKMGDISKGEGRTVLFVSHNMASIQTLCNSVINLDNGQKTFQGDVQTGIFKYYNKTREINKKILEARATETKENLGFMFKSITAASTIITGDEVVLDIEMVAKEEYYDISIDIVVYDENRNRLTSFYTRHSNAVFQTKKGINHFICHIPKFPLIPGTYYADLWASKEGTITSDYIEQGFRFEVEQGDFHGNGFIGNINSHGSICVSNSWSNR
jgi:lipopolysaccharide transport system ATP-binding protein